MTRKCQRRTDVGAYLLDALEAAESGSFTRHLAGCPRCRADIENLEPVIRLLSAIRTRALSSCRWGSDPETESAEPRTHLRLIQALDASPSSSSRPGPRHPN